MRIEIKKGINNMNDENIIQITEEQARSMLNDNFGNGPIITESTKDRYIDKWKRIGYIKKSKLQIAEEYYDLSQSELSSGLAKNVLKYYRGLMMDAYNNKT